MTAINVKINTLGVKGDGVAEIDGEAIFVPFSAPGDVLKIQPIKSKHGVRRGRLITILEPSSIRKSAVCDHFAKCGGCSAQHLLTDAYQTWKRDIVCQALERQKLDSSVVTNLIVDSSGKRRRARFSVRRLTAGIILGFLEMGSHRVVNIDICPVLHPQIVAVLPALKKILCDLLDVRDIAEVAVTLSDTGLDIIFLMSKKADLKVREKLAMFAETNDIARVSWKLMRQKAGEYAEPVLTRKTIAMKFGDIQTEIPPDAFVQPTAWGEQVLRERIISATKGARKVIELFAGCGAFTLPMAARGSHVFAVDIAQDHLDALSLAARSNGLGAMVAVEARNLDRRPLTEYDFDGVDVVVLDPPRVGAPSQISSIAKSQIPDVVYASCNPKSFARDARKLVAGGYSLDAVVPIDQFLWSPHIELVAMFKR